MTEDEMVGWYHWLDGHEFEQALGVGDGQQSLVCCSPWSHKELDTPEQLNWTETNLPICFRRSSEKETGNIILNIMAQKEKRIQI